MGSTRPGMEGGVIGEDGHLLEVVPARRKGDDGGRTDEEERQTTRREERRRGYESRHEEMKRRGSLSGTLPSYIHVGSRLTTVGQTMRSVGQTMWSTPN